MDLTKLLNYANRFNDTQLISNVKSFLARPDIQTAKGARRIELVCENFDLLTFEEAYHLLNADAFRDEFEEMQSYKGLISGLNYLRILLSLAPLIFTWFALFAATNSYQNDLATHADDRTTAFLQLWQNGFNNTTGWTFSTTALIDVGLLMLLLLTSLAILWLEHRARQATKLFAQELHTVTEGLLRAVKIAGNQTFSDSNITKLVQAMRVALGGVFQTNVDKLTQEVAKLGTATTTVATASTNMADSANKMAQSAAKLDASAGKIDAHLGDLNNTEKTMVSKIETSQRAVAAEIKTAAASMSAAAGTVAGAAGEMKQSSDEMKKAAQKVEQATQTIATIDPQTVRQMSNEAKLVAQKTREMADQVAQKTREMTNEATQLTQKTKEMADQVTQKTREMTNEATQVARQTKDMSQQVAQKTGEMAGAIQYAVNELKKLKIKKFWFF